MNDQGRGDLLSEPRPFFSNPNTMRYYYLLIFLLIFLVLPGVGFAQNPVFQVTFDQDADSTETTEIIAGSTLDIENHFDRPERISSVNGEALRLDGYSTWATTTGLNLTGITDQMAIEAYYATECFNEQPVGIISQQTSQAGFSLKISSYGNVIFEFYGDNRFYSVRSVDQLSRYEWHHIVAEADLTSGEAKIYIDGNLSKTQALNSHSAISLSNSRLYLGRSEETTSYAGFLLTVANGALDELSIYDTSLSQSYITSRAQLISGQEPDLIVDPDVRHPDDHLRPRYHPMPNTTWANEAYGFTYFDSTYHLFFQKNPNAPSLHFMHWGHFTSPDLVEWKEEKMALWPIEGFADFGVWSGTTFFDDNEEPIIAYTGVNGQFAGMGLARPTDSSLIEWERDPNNPVIPRPPTAIANLDFRDPYVWKEDSTYFMIVGSGRAGNNGGLLFTYKSTNLVNWINIRPLYQRSDVDDTGYFWEMAGFLKLNEDDYLLTVTPVFDGKSAEALYWIGSWDGDGSEFVPYHEEPKSLVHLSRHLLAPAFGNDENGDLVYIGIIPEDRDVGDQIAAGWRQTFSLPRVTRLLEDTTIGHYPHPHLCRLRQNEVEIQNREFLPNSNFNLPEFAGTQSELELELVPEENSIFSIQVFKNAAASELTSITFDLEQERLGIDRRLSSPFNTLENNRFAPYTFGDTIRVRVFLDHSTLEVFVDNLAVMSARVYPGEASDLFDLVVPEGRVLATHIRYWDLSNKEAVADDSSVCAPGFLPDRFITSVEEPLRDIENTIRVFPNPAKDLVYVEVPTREEFQLALFDIHGKELPIFQRKVGQGRMLLNPLADHLPGVYHLRISSHGDVLCKTIMWQ